MLQMWTHLQDAKRPGDSRFMKIIDKMIPYMKGEFTPLTRFSKEINYQKALGYERFEEIKEIERLHSSETIKQRSRRLKN